MYFGILPGLISIYLHIDDISFGQPRLDVNAGIGSGTSALVVAAMVGNDWAIARLNQKVDSQLPKENLDKEKK